MRNIAIIPARIGSKRINKKNIKDFLGNPIIAYSIKTALKTKLFDEVMVSTDSLEVKEISEKYGANVPFLRSKKNSNDYASLYDVVEEVIIEYERCGKKFDNFCMILATAPFIDCDMLTNSFFYLKEKKYDTVFPIVRFSYPILRALEIEDGKIKMIWPENMKKRSQDLKESFHDAGLFYWGNIKKIIKKRAFFTNNSFGYEIPESIAQDIDTIEDWNLAELKYKLLQNK